MLIQFPRRVKVEEAAETKLIGKAVVTQASKQTFPGQLGTLSSSHSPLKGEPHGLNQ